MRRAERWLPGRKRPARAAEMGSPRERMPGHRRPGLQTVQPLQVTRQPLLSPQTRAKTIAGSPQPCSMMRVQQRLGEDTKLRGAAGTLVAILQSHTQQSRDRRSEGRE